MPDWALLALAALLAYLLGAVPFGLLVGLARGVDIRRHGSGNLGATNVLRVLGVRAGLFVLALDAGKGALPVLALPSAAAALQVGPPDWFPVALAGLAILGHVFPVYLRFQGGKGVATCAGAFLALHPAALGCAALVFALALALGRIVSLASISAALALPLAALLLDGPESAFGPGLARTTLFLAAAGLVLARHRANLGRILAGTEPRLGERAGPAEAPPPAAGT